MTRPVYLAVTAVAYAGRIYPPGAVVDVDVDDPAVERLVADGHLTLAPPDEGGADAAHSDAEIWHPAVARDVQAVAAARPAIAEIAHIRAELAELRVDVRRLRPPGPRYRIRPVSGEHSEAYGLEIPAAGLVVEAVEALTQTPQLVTTDDLRAVADDSDFVVEPLDAGGDPAPASGTGAGEPDDTGAGRLTRLVAALTNLPADAPWTRGGVPTVAALEAASGLDDVTATERDAAWAAYQALD